MTTLAKLANGLLDLEKEAGMAGKELSGGEAELLGEYEQVYLKKKNNSLRQEVEAMSQRSFTAMVDAFAKRLAHLNFEKVFSESAEREALTVMLHIVSAIMVAWLSAQEKEMMLKVPAGASKCARILHDIMFQIGEVTEVQKLICRICELCWNLNLQNREELVPHSFPMMLILSLDEEAKKSDVKRVYSMKKMMEVLDFEDDSSVTLKHLLLRCYLSPLYLYTEDGSKFLSELFWINSDFIGDIHATIKAQLPFAASMSVPKQDDESGAENQGDDQTISRYAELYFKAWRGASQVSEEIERQIETEAIQDLMDNAIHVKNENLAKSLFHLLNHGFHENKNIKGVDAMLLRLYNPILWRSLTVANPQVRFNATRVLARVFPLQDPDAPVAETDELLQKQFSAIESLLKDSSPMVRVTAVQAASRMLSIYWELIPKKAVVSLMSMLVGDLLRDTSSAEVRVAVLRGLEFISENPLSQSALKSVLPHVSPLIHDQSKQVRNALVNLLIRVKSMRDIKFYDVVPVDHLLERLAVDKQLAGKLSKLLQESFFPLGVRGSEQLARAMSLLEEHPRAATAFFENIYRQVPVGSVCKLAILFGKWVEHEVKQSSKSKASGKKRTKKDKPASSGEDESEEEQHDEETLFLAVLQSIATLWGSVASSLRGKRYKNATEQMLESFNFQNFIYPVMIAKGVKSVLDLPPLLQIASHLPVDDAFLQDMLNEMQKYVPEKSEDDKAAMTVLERDLGPALACICAWNCEDQLLECVNASISSNVTSKQTKKRKTKKSGKKEPEEETTRMDRFVALWCVQYILANNPYDARDRLFADYVDTISSIKQNLLALEHKTPFTLETCMKLFLHQVYWTQQQAANEEELVDEDSENKDVKSVPTSSFPADMMNIITEICAGMSLNDNDKENQSENEHDDDDHENNNDDDDEEFHDTNNKKKRKQDIGPIDKLATILATTLHEAQALGISPNAQQAQIIQKPCLHLAQNLPVFFKSSECIPKF